MTAFAYYRLPCEHHATFVAQHVGEPEILSSVAELNGKEGFVIAPFQPSAECPVVLIRPDEVRDFVPEAQCVDDANARNPTPGQRQCLSDHVVSWHAEGAYYCHPALIHEGRRESGVGT